MPNPMIVNYADDILFRGCYRGQKSCHGPLDSLMRVLKKVILKMDARFRYNRGLPRCGFKVKGGWNGDFYFGDENVRLVLQNHYELQDISAIFYLSITYCQYHMV